MPAAKKDRVMAGLVDGLSGATLPHPGDSTLPPIRPAFDQPYEAGYDVGETWARIAKDWAQPQAAGPVFVVHGYAVPQFDPGDKFRPPGFGCWGWHPRYAYWSRSCWFSETLEGARVNREKHMGLYATAIVQETPQGLTVIEITPPRDAEVWKEFHTAPRRPTDAVPTL